MRRNLVVKTALSVALLSFGVAGAIAQEEAMSAEEQAYIDAAQAILETLDEQTGEIELAAAQVTLSVPETFYFLDAEDATTVLVDIWQNPPGQEVLGMLFPAGASPYDYDAWAVTIEFTDDGHVADADAADIDYDELLADLQDEARDANPDRIDQGYEPIEIVGWAETPRYDSSSRKLYWAKEIQFGDMEQTTLNYEIRALGRTGMLSMTFIAATSQLAEINEQREVVLAMTEFDAGRRYEDFDSSIDEVAAYGIGALVAGKVAAKTGLLGAAILLLKKFGIFILIGLAAFGRKIIGLFKSDELKPPS